jgi:holo-[acyl-carrier-protein] synthase
MEIYTGIDIVELERIRQANFFERLAEFILTERERSFMRQSRDAYQYLGSRLAAKEAVIKAIPEPLTLQEVEILKNGNKPAVFVAKSLPHAYSISLSITHTEHFAAASVVVLLQ